MILLKKILLWLRTYWYFPLLILLFIIMLSSGEGNKITKFLRKQKNIYVIEKAKIERIKRQEELEKKKVEEKYDMIVKIIEDDHKKRGEEITKKEKKRVEEIVKENQGRPDNMAKLLEDEFGFKRYGK